MYQQQQPEVYFDPKSRSYYVLDQFGNVIFTDENGYALQQQFQPQQQKPMYQNPVYQQPVYQNQMYQQPMPQSPVYQSPMTSMRLNQNQVPETQARSRSAVPQVQAPVVKPQEVKQPEKTKPLKGNEYKPLVPPGNKVVKEIIGEYYQYNVEKETESMDKSLHAEVYKSYETVRASKRTHLGKQDASKADKTLVFKSTRDLVNAVRFDVVESPSDTTAFLALCVIVHTGIVEKVKGSQQASFIHAVKENANLNYVASLVKSKLRMSGTTTRTTYEVFDKVLTAHINRCLSMKAGSIFRVDSFAKDFDDLRDAAEDIGDTTEKTRLVNSLASMQQAISGAISVIAKETNATGTPASFNIGVKLLDGENAYEDVLPILYGAIGTKNESVMFEIEKIGRYEDSTGIMSVSDEFTPVLYSMIDDAFQNMQNTTDIIVVTTDKQLLVSRTKTNNKYLIEELGGK